MKAMKAYGNTLSPAATSFNHLLRAGRDLNQVDDYSHAQMKSQIPSVSLAVIKNCEIQG